MATIPEALAIAVQHHQEGRLVEAEQIYRQILAVDSDQIDALQLLGVVAAQLGRHDVAVELLSRAIELNGNDTGFHNNLGNAFKAQGKLDKAVESYRRALALKPDFAEAHYNLGAALQDQRKLDEAAACFRRALQLRPDHAECHNNLGNVFLNQFKFDEAVDSYYRALELKPDYAEAYNNLGTVFQAQEKFDEAVDCFRRAMELKPDLPESYNNLGSVLNDQGKLDEAVACCRRALALKPDYAEAHGNLANALQAQGKLEEAVASYRRALELKPELSETHNNLGTALQVQGNLDGAVACYRRALKLKSGYVEAHCNLGNALKDQGKLDEAAESYRRAVELKPNLPEAHNNQALLMLLRGDFERGWPEHEWRWKCKDATPSPLRRAPWDGAPVSGAVLLHPEQGIGDTLQFIRYAQLLRQRAAEVLLRCPEKLIPLLRRCRGIDRLIPYEAPLPPCDAEAHLMSLPLTFDTRLETVPRETPYLFADPRLVEQWRPRLPAGEFNIGIAWQGNPDFKQDKTRSIPLVEFRSLADVRGVRLISLQKEHGLGQLAGIKDHFSVLELPGPMDESAGAFMDTAAVMMNLDLVITSDTAIAHLAGGLGVPVWVALSFIPDWRWLLDRSDSPWYPTMRLFRQTSPGNWPSVFEQIQAALTDRLSVLRTN